MSRKIVHLCLVDGMNYLFRAFHALPSLTRSDGVQVNAVLGFLTMLLKIDSTYSNSTLAVMFDSPEPTFRHQMYDAYKAHREEPPPELITQITLSQEATQALNIPCFSRAHYEADDLLATYCRLALQDNIPVTLFSSDKDLMQLITEQATMFDPIKNKHIGIQEVKEKFGVLPQQIVDVLALIGDKSDNIPGVPSIGVKTAADLINSYGTLENLFQNLHNIPHPKRRQVLQENRDVAFLCQRLVTLDDHIPDVIPLTDFTERALYTPRLITFLKKQEFHSILSRLQEKWQQENPGIPPPSIQEHSPDPTPQHPQYTIVQTLPELQTWIHSAYEYGVIAVDTETNSLHPQTAKLVGIALSVDGHHGCYIPLGHVPTELLDLSQTVQLPLQQVLEALKPLLEDTSILKIGHNIKFDLQVFKQFDINVTPIEDTMLLSYVLNGSKHAHSIDTLARIHFQMTTIPYKQVVGTGQKQQTFDQVPVYQAYTYAAEDASVTLRLYHHLKPCIIKARQLTCYETIERVLVPVIADMEYCGIRVHREALSLLSQEFLHRLEELQEEIYELAQHRFNLSSPQQISKVFFDTLGLPKVKRSKKGLTSTQSNVLEKLAEQGFTIAARLLDWRQLSKLRSTYTEALQQQINPKTGRVHTSFALAHTSTGRLASSSPNLQNIPIRTEDGRKIRQAFIADSGWVLLSVDYSQIELRLIAEIANVQALKHAFAQGQDIHTLTASQMFNLPLEQVTPDLRRQAKAINFGILYGMSSYGLAGQLGISNTTAASLLTAYLKRFPELQIWVERTKEFCREHGFVRTLFGRQCYVADINDSHTVRKTGAERQAINAPIQGTAADIIKCAMVDVPPRLREHNLHARLLLQVHDELVFEVPEDEIEQTIPVVRTVMEQASPSLTVPLTVDVSHGPTWAKKD